MKKNWVRFVIVGIVIGGCLFGSIFCCLPTSIRFREIRETENAPRCSSPVGGFSEANLVGTWVAGVPRHKDALIIRADGRYKQIVHIEFAELPPLDYESGWQPWRLEYSKDNIPYLHLEGMAFCGINSDIPCEDHDGGGYDFCQDKYLPMNGKGILLVRETSNAKPGSQATKYYYYLQYPLGSQNSYIYDLQQP